MNNNHEREADAAGLTILGRGRSSHYRLYKINSCGHEKEIALSCVRNRNFRCQVCQDEKLASEAEEVGLKLIGPGRNNTYRLYRFDKCGHEQDIKTGHVRNNNFKCQICQDEKLASEAERVGLKLIGPAASNASRLYKINSCGHEKEIALYCVRNNNFKCQVCQDEKLASEAEGVGLKLVGPGKNGQYRLYQFNRCLHHQEITPDHVRNNSFKCQICQDEKLASEAEGVGLKLIGPGRNNTYRLYQFNRCLHHQEITPDHVRNNSFKCQFCQDEKLASEAEGLGLKLIGPAASNASRLYIFNGCGHEKEIETSCVRDGRFRCQVCQDEKLASEAEEVGLKLIGPGRNNTYRLYRFDKCGHEQDIKTGHVRNNVFTCNQCEDTARSLPSTVYLIEIKYKSNTWLKLGYSKDVEHRIKNFGLPKTTNIVVLAVRHFDSGREAQRFESKIHKKFSDKRLNMKRLHSISGGTECYPLLLKKRLLSTFNC